MQPTISAAAAEIGQGRVSPIDLLERCLTSIDRYESRVRAWVLVDREQARADAERRTEELRNGHWRGPLHGIPLGIKDIFDVAEWPTAAGSGRWSQAIARRDATVIERLRRAGAVFIGKTVTTQYASFDPPPTRNPWNSNRTPGGSSSGSAAALACGMCLGALGSQTGGSLVRPAGYCGVLAFKPTHGRVSVDGVMPLAPSLDHVGPMANCVRDLGIMLQAMAGPDPRDPGCSTRPVPNYLQEMERPPRLPRLARVRGLFEDLADTTMRVLMDDICERFRKEGVRVQELTLPAGFSEVLPRHRLVMAVEAAAFHEPRLRRYPKEYEPKIRGLLEEGLACPAPEYARCKDHQLQLSREILACLQDVDALLAPAITGPAPEANTTGNPAFQAPWSYLGVPTICMPAGWTDDGLPLSVQVVGSPWREAELLSVAAWCERMIDFTHREPPP